MPSLFVFHPIAVETQGPLNESARDLLSDGSRRIAMCSGERVPFCFSEFQLSCSVHSHPYSPFSAAKLSNRYPRKELDVSDSCILSSVTTSDVAQQLQVLASRRFHEHAA